MELLEVKPHWEIFDDKRIIGLSYFVDAKMSLLVNVFVEFRWNDIKGFFVDLQPKFLNEIQKMYEHNIMKG